MNNKPEVLEYPKCPVCGSEETLIASLAAKEMEKGVSPDAMPQYLQVWSFAMRKQGHPVIIGTKVPAGNVVVAMCKGCGIIRAIRTEIGEAMALAKPQLG